MKDPQKNKLPVTPPKTEDKEEPVTPKTDPQEFMRGPVSDVGQALKKAFDTDETKEEADERKEDNM